MKNKQLTRREAVDVVMKNMLKIVGTIPFTETTENYEWRVDEPTAKLLLSDTTVHVLRTGGTIPRGLAYMFRVKIVIDDDVDGFELVNINRPDVAVFVCRPSNRYAIEETETK